jgi:hypothetical protein
MDIENHLYFLSDKVDQNLARLYFTNLEKGLDISGKPFATLSSEQYLSFLNSTDEKMKVKKNG